MRLICCMILALLLSGGVTQADDWCPFLDVERHCEGEVPPSFGLHLQNQSEEPDLISGFVELEFSQNPGGDFKRKAKLGADAKTPYGDYGVTVKLKPDEIAPSLRAKLTPQQIANGVFALRDLLQ